MCISDWSSDVCSSDLVMGEPCAGRFSCVRRYLKAEGKRLDTPSDWVYVNNFDEPREPRVLELPHGGATAFIADINQLIDHLLATFPAVFEHPSFQQKNSALDRGFNQRYDKARHVIEKLALEKEIALYRDSTNIAFTPIKEGQALEDRKTAV